jgi:hypothetical protein
MKLRLGNSASNKTRCNKTCSKPLREITLRHSGGPNLIVIFEPATSIAD